MNVFRAAEPHCGKIVSFQQIQQLKCGNALCIGRQLVDLVAAIVSRNRGHPLRFMCLQILVPQKTVVLCHVGIDLVCDVSGVEGITAVSRDHSVRVCQTRVAKQLARYRCLAVRHKCGSESRKIGAAIRIG